MEFQSFGKNFLANNKRQVRNEILTNGVGTSGLTVSDGKKHMQVTSATRQVRQQWFSVGIFPLNPSFGLTGNLPQSAPACSFLRYSQFKTARK
jgi:hypothetical protein